LKYDNKGLSKREAEMSEVNKVVCPDCESEITKENSLTSEFYSQYGSCDDCYDPTPAGVEYSAGFEMNH
jgi:hypothetical protein